MLRTALFATMALVATAPAAAQDGLAEGVDFILRPSQDADIGIGDDFWDDTADEVPTARTEGIGTPLPGPVVDAAIGPPLGGPIPAVVPERVRPVRPGEDVDPFAATGFTLGSFVIRPSIEIGVTVTDNVTGSPDGESAVGLLVAPAVTVRSENERYAIAADLRGAAILYGNEAYDERETEARVSGRYDLTSRTSLQAELAYSSDLDRYTDPDTPDAAVERPAVREFAAEAGGTQRFGPLSVGLFGTFERNVHEDVALAGGGTASREELDNNQYGFRVRTGYEVSGALTPFAEAAAGRREYDLQFDDNGFERSGAWGQLRGGLIFNRGAKLSGEIALGYRREAPEDDRLEPLDAALVDAAILWSPRRLTEIRVDLSTDTRATSIPDASGSILHSGTLTAARRFGRFRAEAGLGVDYERFVGADRDEVTTFAFTGLSYALNRRASIIGRYSYERLETSEPDSDSDAHVIGVRMRLQR